MKGLDTVRKWFVAHSQIVDKKIKKAVLPCCECNNKLKRSVIY